MHGVGRRRGKFAALDPIDGIEQARLRRRKRRVLVLAAREHWHELALLTESDVARLAGLPLFAPGVSQMLHGADRIDRQLQRLLPIWRAAELVVDDAESPVCEKVDAIGLSAKRNAPRPRLVLNVELTFQGVFEQPLHHRRFPLGLSLEDRLGQPFVGRRTEQPRALHRRLVVGQRCQERLDDLAEYRPRLGQVLRGDASMPLAVPLFEELLEHLVDENAELLRIQRRFVFGVFLELQHAFGKKSERALQIALERADAVSCGPIRRGRAVKLSGRRFRPLRCAGRATRPPLHAQQRRRSARSSALRARTFGAPPACRTRRYAAPADPHLRETRSGR